MSVYQYDVVLNYDTSKADASLGAFRARVVAQLGDLSSKLSKIELFKDAQVDAKAAQQSVGELSTRVNELKRILAGLSQGDAGFRELQTQAKAATAEISAMGREISSGEKKFSKLNDEAGRLKDALQPAYARVAQLRSAFDGLEKGDAAFKDVSAALRVAERDFANTEKAIARNQQKMSDLAVSLQAARVKVDEMKAAQITLGEALKKAEAGSVGYKTLSDNLKIAEKELRAAEKSAALTADRMAALDVELKSAGIDTKALAAEQIALSKGLEAVRRESAIQTARQTLGVVGADEARGQIAKLTEAYNVLRVSGTASVNELVAAKSALRVKIQEVEAAYAGAANSAGIFGAQSIVMASGFAVLGLQIKTAVSAAISFEQGIARISSISDYSKSQLDSLKRKVLELTQAIGIDAPTALSALYTIISSGVPEQNALTVLEKSAKAAIAGFTDVETAAKIGINVVNAYGLQFSQLDSVFDKLFVTVRDGIVTFPQLAQDLGSVLPAARQAGVGLDAISAGVVTLTRAGFSMPEAATGIENAIKALASPAPEAAAALREAGISVGDFGRTLQEISQKNLSLSFLREIIPDARAIRAVTSLTQNWQLYTDQIGAAATASGEAKKAFDKLKDTPEQQIKKATESVAALRVAVGDGLVKGVVRGADSIAYFAKSLADLDSHVLALGATVGGGALVAGFAALAAKIGATGAAANFAGVALSGLIGFQFGNQLTEWSERVKVFGDLLGASLAGSVIAITERLNLLGATLRGDAKAQDEARQALERNQQAWRDFNALSFESRRQIELLQKSQEGLNKELTKARDAASDALGKYGEAIQPTIAAVEDAFNRVGAAINRAEGDLRQYQSRLAASGDANKALFDSTLASIAVTLDQTVAAVDRSVAKREISESTGLERIARAERDASIAKVAALQQFAATAIQIQEKEAQARLAIASKSKVDEQKVEIQNRDEKIKLLESLRTKYKEYIDASIAEEQRLLARVKELADERRQLNLSAEEKIRELYRGGLSDYQQRADRILEVDQFLARSRAELEKGNFKLSEEYAKKAIDLAVQTNKAVTDADGKQVTQAQAIREATNLVVAGRDLYNEAIDKESAAVSRAADQYGKQRVVASAALDEIKSRLDSVVSLQNTEVKLRIAADTKVIDGQIVAMRRSIEEYEAIQKVRLSLGQVKADIAEMKKLIEDGAHEAVVRSAVEQLKVDFATATSALPSIAIKIDDAPIKVAFAALKDSVDQYSLIKVRVESNVKMIEREILSLNSLATKSTHTVEVKYVTPDGKSVAPPPSVQVPGLSTGGAVNGGAQASSFAGGVSVFSALTANAKRFASGGQVGKVPGTGNKDTVFSIVPNGSFILNKAASAAYELAMRGSSGNAGAATTGIDGLIAQIKAADVFHRGGMLGALVAKTVDAELAFLAKYRTAFGPSSVDPAAEFNTRQAGMVQTLAVDREYRSAVSAHDSSAAQAIADRIIGVAESAQANLRGLKLKDRFDGFAAGGAVAGDGGVPVMLTPGELQFSPDAVRAIGVDRMMALNASKNAARSAAILSLAREFASGGYVQDGPTLAGSVAAFARRALTSSVVNNGGPVTTNSNNTTQNFTINAGSDVSAKQLVRMIGDEIDARARRKR